MIWLEWLRTAFTATIRHQIPNEGQGLVEYALILVLVVIVAFIVVTLIGPWVGNVYSDVVNAL
ncbi:MAG: Flp family type IVb pilin [Aggregatilineales bacterium]